MIFHHPGPVISDGRSGSQVRPWSLLKAFRDAGYEVEPVIGYGADRRRDIKRLLGELARGRHFEFVYAESRSIPTLLTERHRLPLYPLMDFRFLRALHRAGIPVGLFYRDVFWRFDMYRGMLPWPARMITIALYRYDWWWYRRIVDHLFLPSVAMAAHLPSVWPTNRLSALPPGTHLRNATHVRPVAEAPNRLLRLLYVGGVQPPTYDLTPLFESVSRSPDLKLIPCCRPDEWQRIKGHYAAHLNGCTEVVHRVGEALADLYAQADVFALLRKPDVYLDFAVPVKIFESIGYGVPIVTFAGTEAARVVEQHDLGWVASDMQSLVAMLRHLRENPDVIETKRQQVLIARNKHTWQARVGEVRRQLLRYRH